MTLREFEASRPDLAINWDRAHDPAWAEDPNVPGILATGSFENYLRASYGGDFDTEPIDLPAPVSAPPAAAGNDAYDSSEDTPAPEAPPEVYFDQPPPLDDSAPPEDSSPPQEYQAPPPPTLTPTFDLTAPVYSGPVPADPVAPQPAPQIFQPAPAMQSYPSPAFDINGNLVTIDLPGGSYDNLPSGFFVSPGQAAIARGQQWNPQQPTTGAPVAPGVTAGFVPTPNAPPATSQELIAAQYIANGYTAPTPAELDAIVAGAPPPVTEPIPPQVITAAPAVTQQPEIDMPAPAVHTAGMTLAEYAASRPDLLVNWDRAHDPAWANDPNVAPILSFGSLEAYLAANYGGTFSAATQPNQQAGGNIVGDSTHFYQGRSNGFDWYIQDDGVNVWRWGVLAGHDSREIIWDTRELVGPSTASTRPPVQTQNNSGDLSLPPRQVGRTYQGQSVMQLRDSGGTIKQWIDTSGNNDLRDAVTLGVMVHSPLIDGPGITPPPQQPPPVQIAPAINPPSNTSTAQFVPFTHPVSGQTVNIPTSWQRVGTTPAGNPVFQLFENGRYGDSGGTNKEWELNPNGLSVFHVDSTTPGSYSPQTGTVYPGQTVTPQGVPPAAITPSTAATTHTQAIGGMSDTGKIAIAVGVAIAGALWLARRRQNPPRRSGCRSRAMFG